MQLLTPGKSLFVWAPATLLGLLALPVCWRHVRSLAVGLAVALPSALFFYAAYLFPEGGYAHGPRHLVPLVPLLLLPLAVPAVPWRRRELIGCAVFGCLMAAAAVSVSFFEDQSPPGASSRIAMGPDYERVDPSPGRSIESLPGRLHPVQVRADERALGVTGPGVRQRTRFLRAASGARARHAAGRNGHPAVDAVGRVASVGYRAGVVGRVAAPLLEKRRLAEITGRALPRRRRRHGIGGPCRLIAAYLPPCYE